MKGNDIPLPPPLSSIENETKTMSHFTTIKTQIRDVEALRGACTELGLALEQNAEARGFTTNKTRGAYVIRLKGPYDVALNRQPDDSFGLTADLWNGHVEQEVGQNYGKLLQLYAVHKAAREARKKGHLVRRSQQKDGSIKLVIAGV
jgi:hypothetical protein